MNGIVILEGPDATGKTTLARTLVERFNGVYIHNRYHEYLWPFHAATLRWAARLSAKRLVVLDRHWVSEPVYARIFREGSKHAHNARSLYRVLVRFRALHVLCAPPVDAVVENFNRVKHLRPEQYDRVRGVAEAYRALWTGRDGPHHSDEDFVEQLSRRGVNRMRSWMLFDYREHDVRHGLQRICNEILQRVSELRVHAWPVALDYNHWAVAGNVAPDSVLLVGDKVNPNADAAAPWPFFTDRGSSDFLNRALHALRLDEAGLALLDVNDADPGLAREACQLCRRVVALGNNARDALAALGVEPAAVVRHPQSARRFDYHARWQRPYHQDLEEAIGPDAPTL